MKKKFSILISGTLIVGVILSLVGMVLVPQVATAEKDQNSHRQAPKPIPATDVKVVEKASLPLGAGGTKGKPTPVGGAATGFLGTPATGNKYAVVIGICDYPDGAKNYDICLSDGDSYNMYNALTQLYGYATSNIYWFRDMGGNIDGVEYGVPTRENILNAIDTIKATATSGDEVVFFFSGHGASGKINDVDNEDIDEAIVVHDSDKGLVDGNSQLDFIWDEELRILFENFPTPRIVFVFDTCLAGGMNDVADTGRVVNMATGETQSAYVYSTGEFGEGVFSRYFVNEGMLQGLADGYNQLKTKDDNVAVEEAFDYAKTTIPLKHPYLKQRQKPVINDNFIKDLLL